MDNISVRELAKTAELSPTIIQGIKSGARKNVRVQSFFKLLRGLDCTKLMIERNGQLFSLDISLDNKI